MNDLIKADPPKRKSNRGPSVEELTQVAEALNDPAFEKGVQVKGQTHKSQAAARSAALRLRKQLDEAELVDSDSVKTTVWQPDEKKDEFVFSISLKTADSDSDEE